MVTHIRCINKHSNKGAALVIALVFLVLLTILGLSSMHSTTLEEKMAHNARDRNIAFQAAETTLLTAEAWLKSVTTRPTFPNQAKGLYLPSISVTPVWEDTALVNWKSAANLVVYPCAPLQIGPCGSTLTKVSTQPKYIVEDIGSAPLEMGSKIIPNSYASGSGGGEVYRITARGTGSTDSSQVMVQSTFFSQ